MKLPSIITYHHFELLNRFVCLFGLCFCCLIGLSNAAYFTVALVSLQSHSLLQVYGGNGDLVVCMTVHESMVRRLQLITHAIYICLGHLHVVFIHCSVIADLYRMLRRQRAGCEAQPNKEPPLPGEKHFQIFISVSCNRPVS